MDQVRVQVMFTEPTKYGEYTDALYFSLDEYEAVSDQTIETLKAERVANYIDIVENPAPSED